MATAAGHKTMELEGHLQSFKLSDILRFLAMGKLTGSLILENGVRNIVLVIKKGQLVGSTGSDRYLKLGHILVHAGQLSRKDLHDLLEYQKTPRGKGQLLGELLIDRELASEEQIKAGLEMQTKEELWEAFSWAEGSFKFEHGGAVLPTIEMLNLEIEPLIEEGTKRLERWQTIAANLGNLEEVYRVRSDISGPPETALTANEWRVLSLINGRVPLKGLVYLSGLGKFETLNALDRLLTGGLVEPADKPRARTATVCDVHAPTLEMDADELAAAARAAEDPRRSTGLRALLGLGRRASDVETQADDVHAPERPSSKGAGPFLTAAAMGCSLLNHLAERLLDAMPSDAPERDGELMDGLWNNHHMRYPRADLVSPQGNRLDPSTFERYAELAGGVTAPLQGCHDDTMDLLAAMGRELMMRARGSLGRRADEIAERVIKPYLAPAEVTYPVDFMPRAWVEHMLKDAD